MQRNRDLPMRWANFRAFDNLNLLSMDVTSDRVPRRTYEQGVGLLVEVVFGAGLKKFRHRGTKKNS